MLYESDSGKNFFTHALTNYKTTTKNSFFIRSENLQKENATNVLHTYIKSKMWHDNKKKVSKIIKFLN